MGERIEVGSSSSQRVDMVVTSGEVAAIGGVATSSQEVVLDSEQEGDVEEDGEISEDMEEVEGQTTWMLALMKKMKMIRKKQLAKLTVRKK